MDLGFKTSIVSAIPDLSNGIPGSEAPDSLDSRSRSPESETTENTT